MNEPSTASTRWQRLKALFDELSGLPAADRQGELDRLAREDPELGHELAELLEEYDRDDPIRLEHALLQDDDGSQSGGTRSGRRIGPYRLVTPLGRGGMGQVFLAERVDGQYEHRVALKLMHETLQGSEALSRFVAERQILARLEHPNIARLLDGGVTDEGTPFLVMEWVRGETITEHCDRHALGIRERLELFMQVCHAVDAAHRQLIVHRDLKPSNILVDSDERVRLLDFGIAKLLDPQDQATTPHTRTGLYLLTPEYASPEQVAGTPLATTSDVYALGLLLYTLLTGTTAQPVEDLSPVGIHRAVCEYHPPRPSRAALEALVSDPGQRASLRGDLSPTRLSRLLEGDLDTIVEMAIRKEPDRRYRLAEDLAADIDHHLNRRPVVARGDTFTYRAGRFVARHRAFVLAAGIAVVALSAGFVVAVTGLAQARAAERRAITEAESSHQLADFMVGLFKASDPTVSLGEAVSARALLERGAARIDGELQGQPALAADMLLAIGRAYDELGEYGEAIELLERALELIDDDAEARAEVMWYLSRAHLRSGAFETSLQLSRDAVWILEAADGVDPAALATGYSHLGQTLFELRHGDEAMPPLRQAIALRRELPAPEWEQLAVDLDYLGHAVSDTEGPEHGLSYIEESIRVLERADADPAALANGLTRLGLCQCSAGRFDAAHATLGRARELAEQAAGGGRHVEVQDAELALATLAERRGDLDGAARHLARSLAEAVQIWGEDHPKSAMIRLRRGKLLLEADRAQEAVAELRHGRLVMERRAGGHSAHLAAFDLPLAQALAAVGETGEATTIAQKVAALEGSRYAPAAAELLQQLSGGDRSTTAAAQIGGPRP